MSRMASNTTDLMRLVIRNLIRGVGIALAASLVMRLTAGAGAGGDLVTVTPHPTAVNYVIFDPVKLPAHGQVPVWCPAGWVPELVRGRRGETDRKSFVQCVPAPAPALTPTLSAPPAPGSPTPLPPLQSPLITPTPDLAPLATMPPVR